MKYSLSAREAQGIGISLQDQSIDVVEVYEYQSGTKYHIVTTKQELSKDVMEKWKENRTLRCERCGHEWVSILLGRRPRNCPACKSPYWEKPRRSQTVYDPTWYCRKCGHKSLVTSLSATSCPDCGSEREIINVPIGYSQGTEKNAKNYTITPMIIKKDGKVYRCEYYCHKCSIAWTKDTHSANVHCPQCRRACGSDSRRVEIQEIPDYLLPGEVSDAG